MKIAVMGTGGVGGYLGARLAKAGEEVTFIARGAHLDAIRREGLRLESPRGDVHVHPARATDDPGTVGPVDVVLFTVKLWGSEEAAQQIRPLVGPSTAILSLQNGVEANALLERYFGRDRLLGGVALMAVVIDRPGVIKHTGQMARVVFGELGAASSPRAEALLAACRRAEIDAEVSTDAERTIWEKFVFLVGLSGLTALTRRSIGPVREDPDTRALLLDAMREVVAVGRARGVALDPGFAENRLAFADTMPAEMKASMAHDLERGNRLEVGWLSGAVARLGQEAGVPTPVNRAIYAALKLHAQGRGEAARPAA
jgi:2-dehydropantoate 2-reductase